MTRKDYDLIAYAIKLSKPDPPPKTEDIPTLVGASVEHIHASRQWADTVGCIADALQGQNPRFDRERFLAACGAESC